MTKRVRIENADNSTFKVVVEVWDKASEPGSPDTFVKSIPLDNPCDMTDPHLYITGTSYLIVKEAVPTPELAIAA